MLTDPLTHLLQRLPTEARVRLHRVLRETPAAVPHINAALAEYATQKRQLHTAEDIQQFLEQQVKHFLESDA